MIVTFDNYIYTEKRNGAFFAGFGKCKIESSDNPVFLFTTLRILYVRRGRASWRVGSRILNVKPGDIIFVNNAEPRQFVCVNNAPLEASIFAISPALLSKESSLISLFYGKIERPIINDSSKAGRMIGSILDTAEDIAVNNDDTSGVLSHLLLSAACFIKSNFKDSFADCPISSAMAVTKAISIIEERCADIFSVSDLAAAVGLCREHFTVVFKRFVGISPASYIRRSRLERVVYLLKCENINVLDAALICGFSSSSGFYRAFSQEFGTTPKSLIMRTEK